jgi:uncharacterized membrane protein YphA (DoxX/SURF4 family)
MTRLRRGRLFAAWLLGIYLADMYVRMGWSELESDGFWAGPLAHWDYPPWLPGVIGGIEVAAGAALIIPWLASYGGFVLSVITAVAWGSFAHDHRWADVARVTLYAAALTWIAYEWLWLRVGGGAARAQRGDAEATARIPSP